LTFKYIVMNDLKELINILCPKWKPFNAWTHEDKKTALLFLLIVVCFFIGGLIESIPE